MGSNYEETELRLGLPGLDSESLKKRGFQETVDLMLNLSSKEEEKKEKKDVLPPHDDPAKPPWKAQVVGWPPIRSFRKNVMSVQKSSDENSDEKKALSSSAAVAAFVKVSVDGAPYLRKLDLKLYQSYQELSTALSKMLTTFPIAGKDSPGEHSFDLLDGADYVPTYEDRDGDWMLVGDVPWEMFVESCKRLRIMKGSEAVGFAPRNTEKGETRL